MGELDWIAFIFKGHIINYGRGGSNMLGKIRPRYSVIPLSHGYRHARSPLSNGVLIPWSPPPISRAAL